MSNNPSLADFTLSIAEEAFIRATSFKITKAVGLAVYKSVWLRDKSPWQLPIYDALSTYHHREVHRSTHRDKGMMHRKAVLTIYALGETEEEAADTAEIILADRQIAENVLALGDEESDELAC